MKTLRWSLGIAGAVVLLLVLTAVIATQVINPNDYRGELERLVRHYTGRPFVIEGRIHLSWYPWLTLHIGAARLGNLPGTRGPDLIDWRSARIGVRLVPLLVHRRIELDTLRVRGADIHLWRNARGVSNWQPLLAHTRSSGGSRSAAIAIGGVVLHDATLVVREAGKTIRLTHWTLHVGPWSRGRPLSVHTHFVLHAPKVPPAGIPVTFDAHDLAMGSAPLTVTAPQWHLTVASAAVSGSLHFADPHTRARASGALHLSIPSVRALIARLGLKMRLPKDPQTLGTLSVSGRWQLHGTALRIEPLKARLDTTTFTGWAARSGRARPRWTFAFSANHINFDHYMPPTRRHPKPLRLPLARLRALRADGTLKIRRAVIKGATLRDVRMRIK